jgi:hypothetical protein
VTACRRLIFREPVYRKRREWARRVGIKFYSPAASVLCLLSQWVAPPFQHLPQFEHWRPSSDAKSSDRSQTSTRDGGNHGTGAAFSDFLCRLQYAQTSLVVMFRKVPALGAEFDSCVSASGRGICWLGGAAAYRMRHTAQTLKSFRVPIFFF